MASSYPGALDSFTNPTATDSLNDPTVPHATQHADANDAIEAVQGELGINPAGTFNTVVLRLDDIDSEIADINISQVSADAGDELVAGAASGEVDDNAVATYFKFTVDGVEYGVPAYAINP
jgi:hypothetical protein